MATMVKSSLANIMIPKYNLIKRGRKKPLGGEFIYPTTRVRNTSSSSSIVSTFVLRDVDNSQAAENERKYREQETKKRNEKIAKKRRNSSTSEINDKTAEFRLSESVKNASGSDFSKVSGGSLNTKKTKEISKNFQHDKDTVKPVDGEFKHPTTRVRNSSSSNSVLSTFVLRDNSQAVENERKYREQETKKRNEKVAKKRRAKKLSNSSTSEINDKTAELRLSESAENASGSSKVSSRSLNMKKTKELSKNVEHDKDTVKPFGGEFKYSTATVCNSSSSSSILSTFVLRHVDNSQAAENERKYREQETKKRNEKIAKKRRKSSTSEINDKTVEFHLSQSAKNAIDSSKVSRKSLNTEVSESFEDDEDTTVTEDLQDYSRVLRTRAVPSFSASRTYGNKTATPSPGTESLTGKIVGACGKTEKRLSFAAPRVISSDESTTFLPKFASTPVCKPILAQRFSEIDKPLNNLRRVSFSETTKISTKSKMDEETSNEKSKSNVHVEDVPNVEGSTASSVVYKGTEKLNIIDTYSTASSDRRYADTSDDVTLDDSTSLAKRRRTSFQSFLDPYPLIIPNPDEFTPGCRRSTRTRVHTLRKFALEHPIYELTDDNLFSLVGVEKAPVKERVLKKYGTMYPPPLCERVRMRKKSKYAIRNFRKHETNSSTGE